MTVEANEKTDIKALELLFPIGHLALRSGFASGCGAFEMRFACTVSTKAIALCAAAIAPGDRADRANYLFYRRDDAILGMHESEHFAGHFFDNIVVRQFRGQEGDVPIEPRAHGLKASILELQEAGAFEEAMTSQEAVAAIDGVISEVGC
jgi:hypothetical protein